MYKNKFMNQIVNEIWDMKFDKSVKDKKICNLTVKFLTYVVILIILKGVVANSYNQVYNQTLSFAESTITNINRWPSTE